MAPAHSASPPVQFDTIVVGAGISGLVFAHALLEAGQRVVVLEKSRGYGGRLATKRALDAVFDQGPPWFAVHDARASACLAPLLKSGVLRTWADGVIGWPRMNAVGAALAQGLDVRLESLVVRASRV